MLNMWSSRVKRKGTTQVMYIAKLNDGSKRVKKTFSMILEMVFEMEWWRGRKWNHIKKNFWSWSVFLLSKCWLPLFLKRLFELFFFLLSLSLLYMLCLLRTRGFWWYLRRKTLLQKLLFKWLDMEWHGHDYGYNGGGRIFRDGVMHTNMAKPWLWKWGSCGYISGGRIFWSGGMHANISGWG
jgi:hypothetical protein